jgi:hypothetical protein
MKNLLFFITFALFVSCSAEKRLQNLLDKHPELMQTDTQYTTQHDTVIVPGIKIEYKDKFVIDSIYRVDTANVTTFVQVTRQGQIRIKTVVKEKPIYIKTKVPTIRVKYRDKTKKESQLNRTARWLGYGSMLFIVGLILLSLIIFYQSMQKKYGQRFDATLNKLKKQ